MPALSTIILTATAITTSLIAGLFYAWSCSVTTGLAKVSDITYITFIQAANKAIQNPIFFISFMGATILLPVCTFLYYSSNPSYRFWLLLIATFMYLVGVIGVTAVGNIPLNNTLANFDLQTASEKAIAVQRAAFENGWNLLNNVRTISSILAMVLVIIACMNNNGSGNTK